MNFRSRPTCEWGGLPGGLVPFFLRIDVLARVRTNAPNRDSTRRVPASTAFLTLALSKNPCLAARKVMAITAHLHTR